MDSIPGSGRSPGGGHGEPLQYSCLEDAMGRGVCKATARRVTGLNTTEVAEHACMKATINTFFMNIFFNIRMIYSF